MPIDKSCSKKITVWLTTAFDTFIEFKDLRTNFPTLPGKMRSKWSSVTIKCGDDSSTDVDECPGSRAARTEDGNVIRICTTSERRIPSVLLHEMVHKALGFPSELDAEAVEHLCYNGRGAETPWGDDFALFKTQTKPFDGDKNVRVGKIVIWDSTSGTVWVMSRKDGKVVKGKKLFQSDEWKHKYL